MTPNEYREKHKRCATCKYWESILWLCKVKEANKKKHDGRFCRVYKPKEFKE